MALTVGADYGRGFNLIILNIIDLKLLCSSEVLEKAIGGKFDPMYYVKYLEDKFTELYDL
mgnify:CR=1 FL=1